MEQQLDAVIHARVTAAEKAAIQDDARTAGLSVSEFVRRRCIGAPIIASADAAMIRELRRLGGLLKQLYVSSGGDYSEQTAAAIAAITAYIAQLSASPSASPHDR